MIDLHRRLSNRTVLISHTTWQLLRSQNTLRLFYWIFSCESNTCLVRPVNNTAIGREFLSCRCLLRHSFFNRSVGGCCDRYGGHCTKWKVFWHVRRFRRTIFCFRRLFAVHNQSWIEFPAGIWFWQKEYNVFILDDDYALLWSLLSLTNSS